MARPCGAPASSAPAGAIRGASATRTHAARGVLFREVLEAAAATNGLASVLFPERSVRLQAELAKDRADAAFAMRISSALWKRRSGWPKRKPTARPQ